LSTWQLGIAWNRLLQAAVLVAPDRHNGQDLRPSTRQQDWRPGYADAMRGVGQIEQEAIAEPGPQTPLQADFTFSGRRACA
jgi:hypothetical protein